MASRYIPVLHPLLMLAGGAGMFYMGFRQLRRKRLVEDTATSTAQAAAVGPVELAGAAQPLDGKPIVAPFSQRPCAFVGWEVKRKNGKRWTSVKKEDASPFLLRDATGAILVDPRDADVHVTTTEVTSKFGRDPPAHVLAFCERNDIKWEGAFGANHQMRFVEWAIPVGGPVYVLGAARSDGRGDALQGRGAVANALVVSRGEEERTFVVADSEAHARKRFGKATAIGVYGGAALFVVAVMLFVRDIGAF